MKMAAIGFRAKTGRAIGVVLTGFPNSLRVEKRMEVTLTSPAVPSTLQPYHEVMELPWTQARVAVRKSESAIEAVACRAIKELLRQAGSAGLSLKCIGIVGSADRDLQAIHNPHIRAHAAEGILFRRVLEVAASENGLRSVAFAEKGLEAIAAAKLGLSVPALKTCLAELGQAVGPPWRADERAAATAGWLAFFIPRMKHRKKKHR